MFATVFVCLTFYALSTLKFAKTRVLKIIVESTIKIIVYGFSNEHRLNRVSRAEPVFLTCLFDIMIGIGKLDVEIQFYGNSIYQHASSNTRSRNVKEERSTIKRSKAVDMIRSM